jgi:hypothetical protein
MSATPSPIPPDLDAAGHGLRQVLLRLNHYAQNQAQRADPGTRYGAATLAHINDLGALLTAVEQYEQAVLASLPPAPVDLSSMTPGQLLAYRESDPVYKLGYVRGHQAGVAQAQRRTAPVLAAYAQHATLPAPTAAPSATYSDLVQRVRRFLDQLNERRQARRAADHQLKTYLYGTH